MQILLLFLALQAHADETINPQWSLCEPAEGLVARLGLDGEAKETSITYYDSIPVKYVDLGLSFREKDKKHKSKSTVKMRFPSANDKGGDHCEWDRYGTQQTYTCEVDNDDPSRSDPWTKEQRKYAEKFAAVDWDSLRAFGPYPDVTWKGKLAGYDVDIDSVNLPGNLAPLVELSVKVPLAEGNTAAAAIAKELKRADASLCPRQESKTIRLFRELGLK